MTEELLNLKSFLSRLKTIKTYFTFSDPYLANSYIPKSMNRNDITGKLTQQLPKLKNMKADLKYVILYFKFNEMNHSLNATFV